VDHRYDHVAVPGESENSPVRKSLDEIEPFARERGVRIAIENGDFNAIRLLLSEYAADYLGLCYDSGHGKLKKDGISRSNSA